MVWPAPGTRHKAPPATNKIMVCWDGVLWSSATGVSAYWPFFPKILVKMLLSCKILIGRLASVLTMKSVDSSKQTKRQWLCSVHPSLQNNIWSWQSVVCCLDLPKYNLTSVWPKHDELSPLNLDILQFHLSSPLMTNAILLLLTWRTPFPEYQMTDPVPGSSKCLDKDSLKTKMGGYYICVCIWHSIKS